MFTSNCNKKARHRISFDSGQKIKKPAIRRPDNGPKNLWLKVLLTSRPGYQVSGNTTTAATTLNGMLVVSGMIHTHFSVMQ
jgi:hypothetical protein